MPFEIIFITAVLVLSLVLLFLDARKAVFALLGISVLLHKELFSIYSWNIMPVRVFMAALLIFMGIKLLLAIKERNFQWIKEGISNPLGISLLAFWILAGISIIFSLNLYASLSMYLFLTTIIALYFYLILVLKGDKSRVADIIKAYILVAFVLSLIGYVQILIFQKYQFIFGAFWDVPGHMPRVGSLFWDVNHFAGLLVLLLPLIAALIINSASRVRLFYSVFFISISVTLILTNARSGWIAAGVSFLVFALILIFRRFRYKGLGVLLSVMLIASGVLLSQYLDKQSAVRHEIRQYFHYRLDSFDSHFLLLTGSWQIFEKFPFLGGGYGSFYEQFSKTPISATFFSRDPAAMNTRVPAHSIWGELLAETGLAGFTAMVVFYAALVFTLLYAAMRLSKKQEYIASAAMAGSVIGILVAGIFYSYNSEFFWLILFLYFFYALFCLKNQYKDTGSRLWSRVFSFGISHRYFPVLLILILSSFLIFNSLGKNKLIPYDEAIYAQVSKNIVDTDDWLSLSWKPGKLWFEKPPLYFWMSAAALQVLPDSPEVAVRLPSALLGLATVLLIYFLGRRLYGRVAGFISALCLLTTFHFLYYARIGMLDVSVTFFITAALTEYYFAWKIPGLLLSGIFVGLAVLTKGVVGLIPVIVILLYESAGLLYKLTLHVKNRKRIKLPVVAEPLLKIAVVVVSSAIIFLPWHIAMYRLYRQEFISSYLGYHVIDRATMSVEDKNAPLFWYLTVLKVSMRIWFVALLPSIIYAIYRIITGRRGRSGLIFITIWALTVFVLFSVSKSKLVWYIMPVYPALALLIGYFYSAVLNFMDSKLSSLRFITSLLLKSTVIYLTVVTALLYLNYNLGRVYVSDLTGSEVQMIQTKNSLYTENVKVYLDRIELPLVLFYNKGPYEIVDFTPLKEDITIANKEGRELVFITKESRFKKLQLQFPTIQMISSSKEWYLGELPGRLP